MCAKKIRPATKSLLFRLRLKSCYTASPESDSRIQMVIISMDSPVENHFFVANYCRKICTF